MFRICFKIRLCCELLQQQFVKTRRAVLYYVPLEVMSLSIMKTLHLRSTVEDVTSVVELQRLGAKRVQSEESPRGLYKLCELGISLQRSSIRFSIRIRPTFSPAAFMALVVRQAWLVARMSRFGCLGATEGARIHVSALSYERVRVIRVVYRVVCQRKNLSTKP
jgi:hypothetical protein